MRSRTTGSREPSAVRARSSSHVFERVRSGRRWASNRPIACACGGSCPKCAGRTGIDMSAASDASERVADSMAGRALAEPWREGQSPATNDRSTGSGSGRAIPESLRVPLERRFTARFDDVRLHTDLPAQESAAELHAHAFTLGRDIVFARGQYRPDTEAGRRLFAHELAHVVQQRSGEVRVQKQDAGGAATTAPSVATPATRVSTYHFVGCDDGQSEILDRTVRQSFLMVRRAQTALLDYSLARVFGDGLDFERTPRYEQLTRVLQREFGATTPEHVREIRFRFQLLEYKMRQGLTLECHGDAARNQVAEAETPGRRIWFGPKFFDEYGDELHSRPRVFIHELAHNIGVDHDMPGMEIRADGTVIEGAEFAHHADAYAVLAWRLYSGELLQALPMESDI